MRISRVGYLSVPIHHARPLWWTEEVPERVSRILFGVESLRCGGVATGHEEPLASAASVLNFRFGIQDECSFRCALQKEPRYRERFFLGLLPCRHSQSGGSQACADFQALQGG